MRLPVEGLICWAKYRKWKKKNVRSLEMGSWSSLRFPFHVLCLRISAPSISNGTKKSKQKYHEMHEKGKKVNPFANGSNLSRRGHKRSEGHICLHFVARYMTYWIWYSNMHIVFGGAGWAISHIIHCVLVAATNSLHSAIRRSLSISFWVFGRISL